jgi:hypothetical protein
MTAITQDMRDGLLKPQKAFATICPNRTTKPVVALHTTLGQAKSAVSAQTAGHYSKAKGGFPLHEAEVYHLVDGAWVLLHRIEHGTFTSDLPWK